MVLGEKARELAKPHQGRKIYERDDKHLPLWDIEALMPLML